MPNTATHDWRRPLDQYVKSILAEAKDAKQFYGPGDGVARVQADMVRRPETLNRAN